MSFGRARGRCEVFFLVLGGGWDVGGGFGDGLGKGGVVVLVVLLVRFEG